MATPTIIHLTIITYNFVSVFTNIMTINLFSDIWPRAADNKVQGPGRGDRARQQVHVRAGRGHLHQGHRQGSDVRSQHQGWDGLVREFTHFRLRNLG